LFSNLIVTAVLWSDSGYSYC